MTKHGYRHIQGRRICEVGGCMASWPCEVHGTRVAWSGSELPRPRYAPRLLGEINYAARPSTHCADGQFGVSYGPPGDMKCARCGYNVCRHRTEPEVDAEVDVLMEERAERAARFGPGGQWASVPRDEQENS